MIKKVTKRMIKAKAPGKILGVYPFAIEKSEMAR